MTTRPKSIEQLRREIGRLRDLQNEAESLDQRNEYADALRGLRELYHETIDLTRPRQFQVITISPSGRVMTTTIPSHEALETMQRIIGGSIEPVQCGDDLTIWVHEEGVLRGYWPNPIASRFARNMTGLEYYLVGDAIITGPEDEHGRFASVGLVEAETDDDLAVELLLDYDDAPRWVTDI